MNWNAFAESDGFTGAALKLNAGAAAGAAAGPPLNANADDGSGLVEPNPNGLFASGGGALLPNPNGDGVDAGLAVAPKPNGFGVSATGAPKGDEAAAPKLNGALFVPDGAVGAPELPLNAKAGPVDEFALVGEVNEKGDAVLFVLPKPPIDAVVVAVAPPPNAKIPD